MRRAIAFALLSSLCIPFNNRLEDGGIQEESNSPLHFLFIRVSRVLYLEAQRVVLFSEAHKNLREYATVVLYSFSSMRSISPVFCTSVFRFLGGDALMSRRKDRRTECVEPGERRVVIAFSPCEFY